MDRAAVLFDLDGTLIHTAPLYRETYRRAVAPHARRDLSMAEIRHDAPRCEMGFLRHVVPPDAFDVCREAFYTQYEALHDRFFGGAYPGVSDVLETIRARGHPLGIVTGKSRRAWEITVARTTLGPFDVMVFEDDVEHPKPDPAGIRLALDALGAAAGSALYVGDSMQDIHAALAAGVRPVAAAWDAGDNGRADDFAERASQLGAHVVRSPGALIDLIQD